MVRKTTIEKINSLLDSIKKSGLSINAYFNSEGKSPSYFYQLISEIKRENNNPEIIAKYENLKYRTTNIEDLYEEKKELEIPGLQLEAEHVEEEIQDTDDKIESAILRNKEGKIIGYSFKVYRRDKTPVQGTLTRDEMQLIYRLYSYYGASITQREVSRHFPDYSLQDFKRILRAFNITKASGPFAPHMYEEKTEEELKEQHLREKENDFLKKIEKDELNDIKKTTVKLARENRELKQQLESLNEIKIDLSEIDIPNTYNPPVPSEKSIIIHLSDMHIGAKCESNTLYPNKWDKDELKRRLNVLADKIYELGHFDTLILNLLGDNLDGMDNQTARRDHYMPQNMDNMEQISVFIEVLTEFVLKIKDFCNKMCIYSVKDGNHDGITGYAATLAFINVIQNLCPGIDCVLFKDFIGKYEFNGHTYLLCHGKDDKFMKKGLPLNLDEKSKVMIYEWLNKNKVYENNVHFIKGDLHSNTLSSCERFDYRNVLSLFGASDYSNYNFSRNSYGCSYDLFVGNTRMIGTFENF